LRKGGTELKKGRTEMKKGGTEMKKGRSINAERQDLKWRREEQKWRTGGTWIKRGTELNEGRNRNEERRNRVVDRGKGPCFVSTLRNETTSFSSNFCYAFDATIKNLQWCIRERSAGRCKM
jgi:hypothetical protein